MLSAFCGSLLVSILAAAPTTRATVLSSVTSANLGEQMSATNTAGIEYWTDYSSDCENISGSTTTCPGGFLQYPLPNPDTMLFSWGDSTNSSALLPPNSILQIRNDGADSFELRSITLTSTQSRVGPTAGPEAGGPYTPATGTGSMVAYEQPSASSSNNALQNHLVEQQRVDITVNGAGLTNQQVINATGNYIDDTNTGIVQYGFATAFDFDTPLQLDSGDSIELRFYESVWDNRNVGNTGFPDAYYGAMDFILNPEPEVDANDPDIVARAGTGTVSIDMSVTNAGDLGTILNGQFDAVANVANLTTADPENPVDITALAPPLPGQAAATAIRQFEFTPLASLGLSTADVQTTAAIAQHITTNDPNNPLITRELIGRTVGPVLGVNTGSGDALDPAEAVPYSGTIDLGDIDIGAGGLSMDLILANVFGSPQPGDLTTLSIFNIGIEDDPNNYFSILSGGVTSGDPALRIAAQDTASNLLRILFDPSTIGDFTATLRFTTDMNSAYDTASADDIVFTLQGTGISTPAPIPATLWLLGAGLMGLAGLRRR